MAFKHLGMMYCLVSLGRGGSTFTRLQVRNGRRKDSVILTQKEWSKRHYEKHGDRVRKRIATRRRELRQWLTDYKRTLYCNKCQMSFDEKPYLCDLHHNGNKESGPSDMIHKGWGKERMQKEIDKCTPLCANCHREIHHGV